MITLLESFFLGIIQGLTEWLPISSSGHLVIAQQLFNIEASLLFDIFLHAGTLLAVLVFFRKEILDIVKSVVRLDFKSENGRMAIYTIIGTIPISIIGFLLYDIISPLFSNLFSTSVALVLTGIILYSTKFKRKPSRLNNKNAFLIGIAQVFALIPGISRSGITISTALIKGIDMKKAFTFSFILAIPAVIGANMFELISESAVSSITMEMIIGATVAAITGYMSLKLLKKIIKNNKLHLFSYYCWTLGLSILVYSLI